MFPKKFQQLMILVLMAVLGSFDAHADFSFDVVDKMELNFKNELSRHINKAGKAFPIHQAPSYLAPNEGSTELARVNLLIGAFTALDLKIVEFKIKPYVEMRFER